MITHLKLFILLFYFLLVRNVWSENISNDTFWEFDKISSSNLFGKEDAITSNDLYKRYGKVTIHVAEKQLYIKNDLLESNHVCSSTYVNSSKTPLSYFLSQKTVDIYEKILKREGVYLAKSISILKALYPDQACPPPFDEIMKFNERLVVFDDGFAIIFKEVNFTNDNSVVHSGKDTFSKYCHYKTIEDVYDGESKYVCRFSSLNFLESLKKIKFLNELTGQLNEELPLYNKKLNIDGGIIIYEWEGSKTLHISIENEMELTKYIFKEDLLGTDVEIFMNTQY